MTTPDQTKRDAEGREIRKVLINGLPYLRPVIKVANLSMGGSTLTIPADQLGDIVSWIEFDADETYTITFKTMLVSEYEALGDFDGF